MTGADSVDVVTLHKADIPEHIFFGNNSAALCVPLVAIDTLENYSRAVQTHNAVFHLKGTETNLCFGCFDNFTVSGNFSRGRQSC